MRLLLKETSIENQPLRPCSIGLSSFDWSMTIIINYYYCSTCCWHMMYICVMSHAFRWKCTCMSEMTSENIWFPSCHTCYSLFNTHSYGPNHWSDYYCIYFRNDNNNSFTQKCLLSPNQLPHIRKIQFCIWASKSEFAPNPAFATNSQKPQCVYMFVRITTTTFIPRRAPNVTHTVFCIVVFWTTKTKDSLSLCVKSTTKINVIFFTVLWFPIIIIQIIVVKIDRINAKYPPR